MLGVISFYDDKIFWDFRIILLEKEKSLWKGFFLVLVISGKFRCF